MHIAIDTETFLIKGGVVPPLVCLSFCKADGENWKSGVLTGASIKEFMEDALRGEHTLVFHNASFDLSVLAINIPSLFPLIFEKLERNEIEDTFVTEKLYKISKGGTGDGWEDTDAGNKVRKLSLAGLAWKYLAVDIASTKKGGVRYDYDSVSTLPLSEWSDQHIKYATQDAVLTALVYFVQKKSILLTHEESMLKDRFRQIRAGFALALMSAEGVRVDETKLADVEKGFLEESAKYVPLLKREGILRDDLSANTDKLKKIIEKRHIEQRIDVPKTSTGAVSCNDKALTDANDPLCSAYSAFKKTQKLLSTYMSALNSASHYDGRLRASYDLLKQTGRTSCKNPNLQNLPRANGVRDCFSASEGYTLVLCDYDASEMRSLAQAYLDIIGVENSLCAMYKSDPAYDPHAHFGGILLGVDYDTMLERLKNGDKEAKRMRQRAKPCNFGFAGGMGAKTFVSYALQYGVELTFEEAQDLREQWIEAYDMKPWYEEAEKAERQGFVTIPRSERIRGRPTYTQSANAPFQGMSADGAKDALFEVARECYALPESPLFGSRLLVFVHDEIIIESPDAKASQAGDRLATVMVEAMNKVTPDVPASASPALCKRWLKGAETVRDEETGALLLFDL